MIEPGDFTAKASHARTIPIERAISWHWHQDPDPKVRFAMACRLPFDSEQLAYLLADPVAQIAAMAHERSSFANFDQACRDERWMVRQVGVAKTSSPTLVEKALKDINDIVRATAERRFYGRAGKLFTGRLQAIL
jgi:hypothetical protein